MLPSAVYADLPRAGLGNKLLVWAKATIFAHLNGLPLYVSRWSELKIGPYLRNERLKRHYRGYFKSEYQATTVRKLLFKALYKTQVEPRVDQRHHSTQNSTLYIFNEMPAWPNYFSLIGAHRKLVTSALLDVIAPVHLEMASYLEAPVIGVHVRRSDFREAVSSEDLGSSCNVRAPIEYYVETIKSLRRIRGANLPVTIFTDGHADELTALTDLVNVQFATPNSDIVDLLLLARSQCLVVSYASTFSYWSAFLSDAPVVLHPLHTYPIRHGIDKQGIFEGSLVNDVPVPLLDKNIREINLSTKAK